MPHGPAPQGFPGGARALAASNKAVRVVVHNGKSLARRHPLVAKALPTAFGFAFGDVLTQVMNHRSAQQQQQHHHAQQQPFKYEWQRGAKMLLVGGLVAAPLLLGVLKAMDATVVASNPNSLGANALKFTVDQVIGCALWQVAYCSIHPPYRQAMQRLLATAVAGVEQQSAVVRRRLQPALA